MGRCLRIGCSRSPPTLGPISLGIFIFLSASRTYSSIPAPGSALARDRAIPLNFPAALPPPHYQINEQFLLEMRLKGQKTYI